MILTFLGGPLSAQEVRNSPEQCPADTGRSAVYGVVRDINTRAALPGAVVSSRVDAEEEPSLLVLSDARGVYLICDPPIETRLSLRAQLAGRSGPEVTRTLGRSEKLEQPLWLALDGSTDPPEKSDALGRVLGRLVDHSTGQPVSSATLSLASTVWEDLSDERGNFLLEKVEPGPHLVQIRHVAYGTALWPVTVLPGRTVELLVDLEPVPIELSPIVVPIVATTVRDRRLEMTGFYERLDWSRRTGLGYFFTREDIERRNPFRIRRLLTEAPGVQVDYASGLRGCRIVMARSAFRCSGATLSLDGFRLRIFGGESIDDFVVPGDVAGVEVYSGMTSLAGQFADPNSIRCGAVAIWTRGGGP